MKVITLICFLACVLSGAASGQVKNKRTLQYLNQEPPGMVPEVFAPGIVSLKDQHEFGSTFSANGQEFYFGVDINGKAETRFMKLDGTRWTEPLKLFVHEKYSFNDPCLSHDEQKLYVISDRPLNGEGEKKDYDIWYFNKNGSSWSQPVNAGPSINSNKNEYYISLTTKGTMYYSSNVGTGEKDNYNYDIRSSVYNGGFRPSVKLSESVNTVNYEGDVFVAPDESYVIFCAERPDGYGKGDLFISFRGGDGKWSTAKNMGNVINTQAYEFCPFVTRDGKFLFYTSNRDIYWVDAGIIGTMK